MMASLYKTKHIYWKYIHTALFWQSDNLIHIDYVKEFLIVL